MTERTRFCLDDLSEWDELTTIATMDLNLLRALDALLETRSVTAAALRLGLTQPAMSGKLARLREAFDDPLFVRTQHGMLPTSRAEALAQPLKAALGTVEGMLQPAAFDPARAELTIRIAATDYAQRVVILPLLAMLRRQAPGIRMSVRPVDMGTMPVHLEQGALDMALTTPETAADTLRSRKLFEENYVFVMREGHPASQAPLDLDTFCGLDHAIMSHDGSSFRGATDLALDAMGRHRRVAVSVPSFIVLIDLIRASDCCALLPRRLVDGEKGLIVIPPPFAVAGFTKVLVWHERTHHDPGMIWVRERLAQLRP